MSFDTRARREVGAVRASVRGVDTMAKLNELKREDKTRRRAGVVVGAAVIAVLVVGGGWFAASNLGALDSETQPAAPTVVTAEAEAVVQGFLDAYVANDADRALGYLDDDVASWESPEQFRREIDWNEAAGFKQIINHCTQPGASEPMIVCAFDFHGIRSDEIGRGPFGDNSWVFTLQGGKIISANQELAYLSNGFSAQMWEPFAAWVSTTYPDDAAVMYVNSGMELESRTDESIALWEQHTREYVDAVRRGTVVVPSR